MALHSDGCPRSVRDRDQAAERLELHVPEERLSPREAEIAKAYASGDTYHRIAERLSISPLTVRTHLAAIYRKLGVSSKLELHKVLNGAPSVRADRDEQAALISELALSLEESIRRERALHEVLRIISSSNGEPEKVIAAVLHHTLELCDAEFGVLFEYSPGQGFRSKYVLGIPPAFEEWLTGQGTFRVAAETGLGRLVTSRDIVNIADVRGEEIYRRGDPLREATADLGGARSFTAIPMLARDRLIGAFTIYRQRVHPFDPRSLEIAGAFADQSVIAIENARLLASRG